MMKVRELMTTSPKACTLTSTLADAAGLMWQNDCGMLPVVIDGGRVVGVITDRDICMAGVLNARQLAHIAVKDVVSSEVFTCRADDDVRIALLTMKENRVRRLPVIGENGILEGVLSVNDLVLKADEGNKKGLHVSYSDVVDTYKSICQHPLPIRSQAAMSI